MWQEEAEDRVNQFIRDHTEYEGTRYGIHITCKDDVHCESGMEILGWGSRGCIMPCLGSACVSAKLRYSISCS